MQIQPSDALLITPTGDHVPIDCSIVGSIGVQIGWVPPAEAAPGSTVDARPVSPSSSQEPSRCLRQAATSRSARCGKHVGDLRPRYGRSCSIRPMLVEVDVKVVTDRQ